MALSLNFVVQVNCSLQKHSKSGGSYSSGDTFKRIFKELQQIPNLRVDVTNSIKRVSSKLLDDLVDSVFQFTDQPLTPLQSNFAPVDEMKQAVSVYTTEGTLPDDFPEGVYMRNGPNPLFGGLKSTNSIFGESGQIWIEGEGMLHTVYFKKGNGRWSVSYNSRQIETETYKQEKRKGKPSFLPAIQGNPPAIIAAYLLNMLRFGEINKHYSNTNVFEHFGRIYSTAEHHVPQEIDISTLETLGNWNINGAWNRPFTSHPKKAPDTAELVIMGVDAVKPYIELGVVSADGERLVHKTDLKFSRCSLSHDMGVTQRYNVIFDFPLTIDVTRLFKGDSLLKYNKEDYARIGVMPRYGDADSVHWFNVESSCVFHILNCYEEGDEVVVRGCKALDSIISGSSKSSNKPNWFSRSKHTKSIEANSNLEDEKLFTRCYEWRLDMKTGVVNETYLTGTDHCIEFPFINEAFTGVKNKFGYMQVADSDASKKSGMPKFGGLAKLYFKESNIKPISKGDKNEEMAEVEYHMFEQSTYCTGAAFVPKRSNTDEDDGWIITFVHNEDTNISKAHIIDAKKFSSKPVAEITLPCRVPYGFHGAFMPTSSQNVISAYS